MRLRLLSSLWMLSVFQIILLTVGVPRNLLSQEASRQASPQIKSGDLELEQSRVYVRVGKVGLGHEHGASCKLKSSTLHLSQPDAAGSYGKLVFDMTSFEADSDASRKYVGLEGSTDEATKKQVNENLLGKDVLDVEKYPIATFEAKRVTKLDELSKRGLPKYKFEGDFTLHGQPSRLNLPLMSKLSKVGITCEADSLSFKALTVSNPIQSCLAQWVSPIDY